MARENRRWISQEGGSFHIISRIAGGELLLKSEEKDYFLELLERFASGFFVRIHAFCIMGNHFHILATGMEQEAQNASKKELFRRYRLMYGKSAEPPEGRYDSSGNLIPDPGGGVQRLRERLGSVSRFVQELKQMVACNGYLGVFDRLRYRVKNFSEGVAIGVQTSIECFQSESNRKYIRARNFLDAYWSYATRVLRS